MVNLKAPTTSLITDYEKWACKSKKLELKIFKITYTEKGGGVRDEIFASYLLPSG